MEIDMRRRTLLELAMAAALAPAAARAQAGAGGETLTIGMIRDLQGALDPTTRLSTPEANVLKAVCPGLIAFKPSSFEWQLALAKSIGLEGDTTIGFELAPGHQFTDGFGEVTAEDVKFSFERFRQKDATGKLPTYAADWEALDTVEVTGKYTGKIRLKSPSPMLWTTVLPDASGCIISRKALEQGAYRTDKPPVRVIGAGSYTFAEWTPNQRTVLRANPDWKGAPAAFKEIVLRPIRDPKTTELALRSNELQFAAVDPQNRMAVAKVAGTKVLSHDSINMVWLGINVEKKPFDNPRVRQAIRAAIDVNQVVEGGWNASAAPAAGPIAPGLLGYWEDAPKPGRDVAAARMLLQDAGLMGLSARLTLLNVPAYTNAAVIIQSQLEDAGMKIDLDVQDSGSFWSAGGGQRGHDLELSLQRFGGKADPAFQMQWFVSGQIGEWNWERWSDPEFDRLVHDAAATNDTALREKLYIEAQQRMEQSAAFIWLTHETWSYGFRDWLKPAVLPNGDDMSLGLFTRV